MSKRRDVERERREANPAVCEIFGRFDALYHRATGKRLERSARALATMESLLCHYGMCESEEVWAWWVGEPAYGRDGADPLDYFAGEALDDIRILALAEGARLRLASRSAKPGDLGLMPSEAAG